MGFRMAKRSSAKPLIGIYSASGCGKTMSALLLARGFVGPKGKIGMIDTEAGRGEAFADMIPGSYNVEPIADNFGPKIYEAKIKMAEKEGVDALIIDSASHEWEGAGGVLSMAEKNIASGMNKRQVWTQPKVDHNRHFILPLVQTPISIVIVCMRGKFPLVESKNDRGKLELTRATVPVPIQSDQILFEMFIHGWIDEDHCFRGTKYTRPDLRDVLVDKKRISIETGQALARWSAGGEVKAKPVGKGIIDDVLALITGADSQNRLADIGQELKSMSLSGSDRERAKEAYLAREKELK